MKIKIFSLLYFLCLSIYSQQFRNASTLADLDQYYNNNGVSVADYDQDGDLDIFLVSYYSDGNNDSRLLENTNNGNFIDVTAATGINQNLNHEIDLPSGFYFGDRLSASWGDFNNDGYPDLFLGNSVQSELYKNNGDGSFTNITESAGFQVSCEDCYITGALWLDYDLDGFLDIFLSDYHSDSINKLYRNLGNETFELIDLTQVILNKNSFSAIFMYINDDAYPDIYIANDFDQDNALLINQGGSGFVNQAESYQVLDPLDGMGLATCDYDNDLDIDFLVTNIKENSFFVNEFNLEDQFTNLSEDVNIYDTNWAWGAIFSDFNHDGYEDLYIANGFFNNEKNEYFRNVFSSLPAGRKFQPAVVTDQPIIDTNSRSVNSFDYDNDGDLDLLVTNINSSLDFYENKSIDTYYNENISGAWIKIHLEGTTSNRDGLGAVINILDSNDDQQTRLYNGSGFQHQSLQPIHFGLNDATLVNTISVTWPNTGVETYTNIDVNSTVKIVEGSGIQVVNNNTANKIPGCTDSNSCNYNTDATVDDNSCVYLTSGQIDGTQIVAPLETYSYSYSDTSSTNFLWDVTNGTIIQGQGTNTIEVRWDIELEGSLSIIGSDDNCNTNVVEFNVSIELSSINDESNYSISRLWNEVLLEAIRNDLARPTVHARNLFHTSAAIYDAWSIVNSEGTPYLMGNLVHGYEAPFDGFSNSLSDVENNNAAISYAAYRIITHRFSQSPGYQSILSKCNTLMSLLNYNIDNHDIDNNGEDPIALGNYIAENYISYGLQDSAMEQVDYVNQYYQPVNEPLVPILSGNPSITNPNRWQPLSLNVFIDQSGNILDEHTPEFLGAEWGNVNPFGLDQNDMTTYTRDGNNYYVYHDPGQPPELDDDLESDLDYIDAFSMVSVWGSHLSQDDGVMWDISPNNIGNVPNESYPENLSEYNSFFDYFNGGDNGMGYSSNPVTNQAYETQLVPRGDYTRVLAEFWADGPDSETPPGHWFVLLNSISDNPLLEKKFQGTGDELSNLEWDVKSYFILGGVMHDVAITAWGIKGWYDYVRPISSIRYMADLGQSTDQSLSNYNSNGLPLINGYIEVINEGDLLAGDSDENVGKIKLYSWKGHDYIDNPSTDQAGVGWILAEEWWPYQRPTFVTPNFAGYVSGHSTYSRAAAEALTLFTGSPYFPGGMGEYIARENEFLVFEEGPSQDVKLQWASYRDASDQCSLSRIWGGIHPYIDDIPGRFIGSIIGVESFNYGAAYFETSLSTIDIELPKLKLVSNPIYPDQSIEIINTTGDEVFKLYNINGQQIKVNSINNQYRTSIIHPELNPGIYLLKSDNITWKILVR